MPEDEKENQDQENQEQEEKKDESINPDDFKVETYEEDKSEEETIEGVDEEDQKVISKVVQKQTSGLKKELQETKIESEVDRFIADNPDFKRYRGVILKYKKTPRSIYQNVPVDKVAKMIAYEDAKKIGAKKEREAQNKVDQTKGGGSSRRKGKTGEINWMDLSKEEYQKKKAEVLGRSR